MTLDPRWRKYFSSLDVVEPNNGDNTLLNPASIPRRRRSSAPFETMKVPSEAARILSWTEMCKKAGLSVLRCDIKDTVFDFGNIVSFRSENRQTALRSFSHHLHFQMSFVHYVTFCHGYRSSNAKVFWPTTTLSLTASTPQRPVRESNCATSTSFSLQRKA